jgi:hypothetical protein
MSIFSRLFQKEDGTDDTPADGSPIAIADTADTAANAVATPEPPAPASTPERTTGTMKAAEMSLPLPKRATAEQAANDAAPKSPAAPAPAAAPSPAVPATSTVGAPPPVPAPKRTGPARHKTPPPARVGGAAPEAEISESLETVFPATQARPARAATPRHGVSTPADLAAVRATFEDLSIAHVRPLRNMMIDLKWGEPVAIWLDLARPALKSLRKMADQVELTDLVKALDGFSTALDKAVQGSQANSEATRDALLSAYAPLVKQLPKAFELEGERDRREPIIVQSVLRQVAVLEPLMVQRLYAVGLSRLDTLLKATAEEIAVVADLPAPVATAVVAKVQELRRGADGAADVANTRRAVQPLVRSLESIQHSYEKAASGWSVTAVTAKRKHRKERELTFLQIKVALARAGEVDLCQRIDTLSYARRIDELERYLREAAGAAAQA